MYITESFELHNDLNDKLFENEKLKSDVRQALLNISDEFINTLEIKPRVLDVQLVGSNASFNYTQDSDIDLHIISLFDDSNCSDILKAYYAAEKSNFNKNYDIKVKGINVEVYIEDSKSASKSNGVYSVLNDEWVKYPEVINIDTNLTDQAVAIADKYVQYINQALNSNDVDKISQVIDDVYLTRHNALASEGEFGLGNLIFKEIRNRGLLDELKDKYKELRSSELTLESLGSQLKQYYIEYDKKNRDKNSSMLPRFATTITAENTEAATKAFYEYRSPNIYEIYTLEEYL